MRFPIALAAAGAGLASAHAIEKGQPNSIHRRALSGKPSGADTSGAARTKFSTSAAWAPSVVYDCYNPGDVALTFDDGPYWYTSTLLDKLAGYGVKATFFLNGDNYGRGYINDPSTSWPAIIRRMANEGHQIASHTWDHASLSSLSDADIANEMIWNEIAINDILGYFPTYMRPPYGDCDGRCQSVMSNLGYHIIMWNLDTLGYNRDLGQSQSLWDQTVGSSSPASSSFLNLEHDPVEMTVNSLVDYFIPSLQARGFRAVTVGECLNDPASNWYRTNTGGGGPTDPVDPPTGGDYPVSTNGQCGNAFGTMCDASSSEYRCCSQYGWCGASADHCGTGCQTGYGTCDNDPVDPVDPVDPDPEDPVDPPTGGDFPISTTGQCGSAFGTMCDTSTSGYQCCSQYGWCGASADHCGGGCQTGYGLCGSDPVDPVDPEPEEPDAPVSTNGQCGQNGMACPSGQCCSQWGWCGVSDGHCGGGCQPSFGTCS